MTHVLLCFAFLFALESYADDGANNEMSDFLLKTAQEHILRCEGDSCPEGVGTLVTEGIFGRVFCRAFVINENTVMTAGHCVELLTQEGGACEGKLYFKFANEAVECKSLKKVKITEDNISMPDYAIIELKNSISIPPVELQRTSFEDEQSLYFYKTSYDFETNSSTLRRVNCRTKKLSTVTGMFFSELPPVISMGDCPFEEGDSGGPVFNEQNQVVALIHGGIMAESRNRLSALKMPYFNNVSYLEVLKMHSDSDITSLETIISATTMTCMESSEIEGDKNCKPVSIGEYAVGLVLDLRKEYLNKLSSQLPPGSFEITESKYIELLSKPEVSPEKLKPSDYVDIIEPKVDCKLIPAGTKIPVQSIHTKIDTYFRLILKTSYEVKDLCAQ